MYGCENWTVAAAWHRGGGCEAQGQRLRGTGAAVPTHMELLSPKQVEGDHMGHGELRLMPAGGAVVVRMCGVAQSQTGLKRLSSSST